MITNNQKELIVRLSGGGMTYRRIGELFGISHTAVKDVKKASKTTGYKCPRQCILCGAVEGLINEDKFSICESCLKIVKNTK